jgi:Spy/CpxP family protein refolding chaperone
MINRLHFTKGFLMQKHVFFSFIILFTAALLSTTAALAQMRRPSPEVQAKMLKDSLQLSDDQTAKITDILAEARKDQQDAMSANQGDRQAMRSAMMGIMKNTDKKITTLLSTEQAQKFESMQKNRREYMMRQRQAKQDSTK